MSIKGILRIIWNEFVYGGHLLSLGAVSIVFTSALLLDIKTTWDCLAVAYFGTEAVYLYDRYKGFKKDALTNPERTKYIKKYLKYIPLIVFLFSFAAVSITIYFHKIPALVFGLSMLFLGLLYSVFFKKLTRKIVGFKNLFVSLVWSVLVVFLALYYGFSLTPSLLLVLFFVYLRLFIHEGISDIKDIESDKKEGLLALPILLKQGTLFNILNLINILATLPIIFGYYLGLFPKFSLMLLFVLPYTFYSLSKAREKKISTNLLLIDGEFILWSILLLIGKILL